jgi:hypothetical protein
MATIITREVGTSSVNRPLTNAEIDNNFINLNAAIANIGGSGGTGNSFTSYTRTSFLVYNTGQTTFTATYTPNYLQVYRNGVLLNPTEDYIATNGTNIVLTVGAVESDVIEIISFSVSSSGSGNANIDGGIPSSTYTLTTQTISGGTPSGI